MIAGNPRRLLNDPWRDDPWQEVRRQQAEARWERIMAEFRADTEAAAAKLARARYESQQAFRRPPKRCGHGKPPMRKWGPRKR